MSDKNYYLLLTFGNQPKYVKTTSEKCEIIKMVNGQYILETFPKPYPTFEEEDYTPITKEKYDEIRKQVSQL